MLHFMFYILHTKTFLQPQVVTHREHIFNYKSISLASELISQYSLFSHANRDVIHSFNHTIKRMLYEVNFCEDNEEAH